MSDEIDIAKVRRAREVLDGADWVFDQFINAQMGKILTSAPDAAADRETAYQRARVATELKAGLMAVVQEHEDTERLKEARKPKENQDGR